MEGKTQTHHRAHPPTSSILDRRCRTGSCRCKFADHAHQDPHGCYNCRECSEFTPKPTVKRAT